MTVLNTFASVNIKNGVTTSPVVFVGAQYNWLNVRLSRENWPVAGATLELLASFDGGTTYETVAGAILIVPFVPTVKNPSPTDASIGFGWNPARRPTHAKGRATSASAFSATLVLEAG